MSGIYIHVPYCKHKCDYCDFFSVDSFYKSNSYPTLIAKELHLRRDYFSNEAINTIYLGGGTPSLISIKQLASIINSVNKYFKISSSPEFTIEANPDDLSTEYLKDLISIGVNRLSIGIQSFSDSDLKQLGRRHDAKQAFDAVLMAKNTGFENISIDLIYGLPYSSNTVWANNLKMVLQLPVTHLSSYHLIYETGTPLFNKLSEKKISPVSEDDSIAQFNMLQEFARKNGFIHYEVSNFAKDGYFSKHNASYWKQKPYLGVGPSAHSYNGITREWNPKSIEKWSENIENNTISSEKEILSETDHLNDYLLTSLRTMWGINLQYVKERFGERVLNNILAKASKYISLNIMDKKDLTLTIRSSSFLVSDGIISDFFVV